MTRPELLFYQLVRAHKKDSRLSLDDLSRIIGIKKSTLHNWTTKTEAPHLSQWPDLLNLAKALALSYDQLSELLSAGGLPALVDLYFLAKNEEEQQLILSWLPSNALPAETPHNLPAPVTTFVGRSRQMELLHQRLKDIHIRLITIWGPPGVGKTRLALEAAHANLRRFEGVYFVSLAALTEPELLVSAIAETLGVREGQGKPLPTQLKTHIGQRQLLLLLDNFDHLLDAAAFTTELLEACPKLKLLVTSREALQQHGETLVHLSPLALPEPKDLAVPSDAERIEAIKLFVARAQSVDPNFVLSPENISDVAALSYQVDGLPLGVELAAGNVDKLTVRAILRELRYSLERLQNRPQARASHQQTLMATIEWSYRHLDERSQSWLRRLSVFVGYFTLDEVKSVYAVEEGEAHILISSLAELAKKSLLQSDKTKANYLLLETIRHFGEKELRKNAEWQRAKEAHADYFLTLAEKASGYLYKDEHADWLDRLQACHANIRAVLQWCRDEQPSLIPRCLNRAITRFWLDRGYYTEARTWLESVLHKQGANLDLRTRARILIGVGTWREMQSEFFMAHQALAEAASMHRQLLDSSQPNMPDSQTRHELRLGLAETLRQMANISIRQNQLHEAHEWLEECSSIFEEEGDRRRLALCLSSQGATYTLAGAAEIARPYLERGLVVAKELNNEMLMAQFNLDLGEAWYFQDKETAFTFYERAYELYSKTKNTRGIASAENGMGITIAQKQPDVALAHLKKSLAHYLRTEDRRDAASVMTSIALVSTILGEWQRALMLISAAITFHSELEAPLSDFGQKKMDEVVEPARQKLSAEMFAHYWAKGQNLTWEEAISLATSPTQA